MLRQFILGAGLLALGACGASDPPQLIGTYRSTGKCPDEVLTLTGGDKFMHTYGKETYEGTWRAGEGSITLSPFRAWSPSATGEERAEIEGAQASFARALIGDQITIAIDAGCSFVKK